jgi:hypothetical protein
MVLEGLPKAGADDHTSDASVDDRNRAWHAPRLTALGRLDSLTALAGGSPATDGATQCTAGTFAGDCGTI